MLTQTVESGLAPVAARLHDAVYRRSQKPRKISDHGTRSTVYRCGDSVVKVVKLEAYAGPYVPESSAERRRWADILQEQHDAMADYLGDMVASHEISVGADPGRHNREAVLITQPYYNLDYLTLSVLNEPGITRLQAGLAKAESRHPGTLDQLSSMITASRVMRVESGRELIPDVVGVNNMGINLDPDRYGELVITDAQPIPKTDGTHDIASRHLLRLEAALGHLSPV